MNEVYEFVMRLASFTRGSSSRNVNRANGGRERAKESIKRIYGREEGSKKWECEGKGARREERRDWIQGFC